MSKPKTEILQKKLARFILAELEIERELRRLYPFGSDVFFTIMHGQQNPSMGEVIGWSGGRHGCVRVRLNSRTKAVRDVPYDAITGVCKPVAPRIMEDFP